MCEACQKVDTFCHFNLRLDTRRKLAYKPRIVRERQQYILEGVLQILKHNDSNAVQEFIKLIRSEARPQEIAYCLKQNLHHLQGRGLIPVLDVDETDLVSLGLQSLFSHRAGRNVVKTTDEMVSPTSSERDHIQNSFSGTIHSNFGNRPTTAEDIRTSFSRTNASGLFETEHHVSGHLDDDSFSEANADLAYSHHYTQVLLPTNSHSAPSFGVYAGVAVASNNRPKLQTANLPQPEGWRTASPASLQKTTSQSHESHSIAGSAPSFQMYNFITPTDEVRMNFKELSQKIPVPCVSMRQSAHDGNMDDGLLFRDHTPHVNIPSWACEVRSTMF